VDVLGYIPCRVHKYAVPHELSRFRDTCERSHDFGLGFCQHVNDVLGDGRLILHDENSAAAEQL
jgi:hypothetical protein